MKRDAILPQLERQSGMEPDTLTIWGRRDSFNVQKVMWLIGELAIEHRRIPTGGEFGGRDTPEFLAMNPHGRIPTIAVGDKIVWESHAILRFLAAHTRLAPFWTDDAYQRSLSDRWMDWSQTVLEQDLMIGVFWGMVRVPEDQRNWKVINEKLARCTAHFALLNRILENRDFLLGDAISLADISIGATLYRYFTLDIDRPAIPNVEAWYARLKDRPVYREHVMVSYENLRGRPDG
ncbi:glutathione S-transferase family protein [Undibacterium sp. Ji83W]|uniref:glutathione S-transferase family protein n=1 Tax=Undibacterium sp. Ji83W TaxID=3413043 RepID=UPI003BF447E0